MSTFHAYVDAAHFHEALDNVLRFAAKRSRLPILEEAQVRFEDGHCVLTCTNLDQWCMSTIPAVGGLFLLCVCGDPENPLRLQILFRRTGVHLHD